MKSVAAIATVVALGFGAAAPATSVAKVKSKKAKSTRVAPGGLSELCTALRLKPFLDGLTIDLTPIVVVRLNKVCE